ncbi:MAG: hypothetical protein NTZ74_03180 [Chloroflexi bacterium]|nr:hypothetical protein [Chloroflexota bacterium]
MSKGILTRGNTGTVVVPRAARGVEGRTVSSCTATIRAQRRFAVIANTALEAIRAQTPLFALDPLLKLAVPLKWRDRITRSALKVRLVLATICYLVPIVVAY